MRAYFFHVTVVRGILFFLVGLVVLGVAFQIGRLSRDVGSPSKPDQESIDADTNNPEHTSILELDTAYKSNELAADRRYKGRPPTRDERRFEEV